MTALSPSGIPEQHVVRIEPWGVDDLPLLEKLVGDPEMMKHLGGPEGHEKILERQGRYEKDGSRQFKIIDGTAREAVGWVGYWERAWRGDQVYEIGWAVVPTFQRKGIASAATKQAIAATKSEEKRQFLHAFPSVGNAPSNAICRKLCFTLVEACDFEYPPGKFMRCNDWCLDLSQNR